VITGVFESAGAGGLTGVAERATRDFDSNAVDWQECGEDGFWIKPLFEDAGSGMRTWLMKVDAGAFSPLHAHEEFEQVYVIEGSFYDQDKTYAAGEFILRAPGAMHSAGSRDGAVMLLFYHPAQA